VFLQRDHDGLDIEDCWIAYMAGQIRKRLAEDAERGIGAQCPHLLLNLQGPAFPLAGPGAALLKLRYEVPQRGVENRWLIDYLNRVHDVPYFPE